MRPRLLMLLVERQPNPRAASRRRRRTAAAAAQLGSIDASVYVNFCVRVRSRLRACVCVCASDSVRLLNPLAAHRSDLALVRQIVCNVECKEF